MVGRRAGRDPHPALRARDWVAIILAIGFSTSINLLVFGVLYDAITQPDDSGLSENATQVLIGWGGGVIGVLGSYLGFRVGEQRERERPAPPPSDDEETPVV